MSFDKSTYASPTDLAREWPYSESQIRRQMSVSALETQSGSIKPLILLSNKATLKSALDTRYSHSHELDVS